MNRTLLIAIREFKAVVFTKGFVLGILLTPVMVLVGVLAVKLIPEAPEMKVKVALIDQSGAASDFARKRFGSEGAQAEAERVAAEMTKQIDQATGEMGLKGPAVDAAKSQVQSSAAMITGGAKSIALEVLDAGANVDELKNQVKNAQVGFGAPQLMAVVVVPKEAVSGPLVDGKWAEHQLFIHPKLDFQIASIINRRMGDAIVDARITSDPRFSGAQLSPEVVRATFARPDPTPQALGREGDKPSMGAVQMIVPFAMMILLMLSVMTGGQYLMTALVEEKSNRVMEVLLSAVSPMQLMTGKIIGMMCVALLILTIYGGAGIAGLIVANLVDLIETSKLIWLAIFFFCAFFTIASMMAAVGAAVNDIREAQTFLTPVMLTVMLPWLMVMPISRAPNSTFATVLSFVPVMNPFVSVIRLGGSEPVPNWQLAVSAVIGVLTALVTAWIAAKIFRIGVLMYGKPPNFTTLIRWVRIA
ncbi:MAG: ABC transporter permease [Phycisphaerales bacterium]|nr:ABC transporter permease [Phycisphaerales bacterium]